MLHNIILAITPISKFPIKTMINDSNKLNPLSYNVLTNIKVGTQKQTPTHK